MEYFSKLFFPAAHIFVSSQLFRADFKTELKGEVSDSGIYKNAKCARSQSANRRKNNCKQYLIDLMV